VKQTAKKGSTLITVLTCLQSKIKLINNHKNNKTLKVKRVPFCKISIKTNGIAKLDNKLIFFCHLSFKPERLVNMDTIPGTSLLPPTITGNCCMLNTGYILGSVEQSIVSFS